MRTRCLAFALVCLAACGGTHDTSTSDDLGGSTDVDTTAEAKDTATHGDAPTTIANAKAVSSLFVQEDPTIDPTKTAAANADAVAQQLHSSVMASCTKASIAHASGALTVSIDFGTGCTVAKAGTVAGTVMATVAKTGDTVTIGLAFTNLVVNGGKTTNGTLTLSTTTGTSYTVSLSLNTGNQVAFDGAAALDADGSGITLDGTGSSTVSGGIAQNFKMSAVHHAFSACYADAGTMSFTKTAATKSGGTTSLTESMAFSSTTPSTGTVIITIAGLPVSTTLPAYGTCPHP